MTSTRRRSGTASRTIADLLALAVEAYAQRPALMQKREGSWLALSYEQVGETVSELARGLIDLGLEPGDRLCILAATRPEWTFADFAASSAGLVVVPIYATNSPQQCAWVIGDSQARAIVCEDEHQLAKVQAVRSQLPDLEHLIAIEPGAGAITFEELRERGRSRDPGELARRSAAVAPEDPFTLIYTSGTTGPPKGCVLSHGNYRAILDMCIQARSFDDSDPELTYLYLPLAHAFALLVALLSFDLGGTIAYFGGDTGQILNELREVRPTYLPSVPRIFEKIYSLVSAGVPAEQLARAVDVGRRVRDLQAAGEPVAGQLQEEFTLADQRLFAHVRAAFGGRLRQAVTGAAPIAPAILEFFWAAGVPVLEGYGMTETSTAATYSTAEQHRFGSVGRALPGVEIRIAPDGEILLRGPNIFRGYWRNEQASAAAIRDGWLHTGDLGRLDEEGYLYITGRKKEIIITSGGKNLTPANLENDMRQSRWVSQAVMYGDRRPYPVMLITLDPEEIIPWARERGIADTSPEALAVHPEVRALIQSELDRVNTRYAPVEQVKRFFILERDLSQAQGELTPTLKVKREVVYKRHAGRFAALYE